MKKLTIAFMIAFLSYGTAFAVEVPEDAQQILDKPSTAYRSVTFNSFLTACGIPALSAAAVAGVPASYAKVSDDAVKFNNHNMVYPPAKYHAILTSYGLEISPEKVSNTMGYIGYARVKGGEVVFGKDSAAYTRSEWVTILGCYTLADTPMVVGTPGDADGDGVTDDKDACPGTPQGIQVDSRGCWSHSAALLFAFDSAEINAKYEPVLNDAKRVFDAHPEMTVQIDGYTCNLGSESYNQGLSVRRAQAVKDYLVNKAGININRLTIKGYGESTPAYSNDSEAGRVKNRRVEFTPSR